MDWAMKRHMLWSLRCCEHANGVIKDVRVTRPMRSALACVMLLICAQQACAQMSADAGCEQQARHAGKLAETRDRGLSEQQAVDEVFAADPSASRQELAESAQLLFHRFRRMPPDQAAFEFMASCLDEAH